MRIFNVVIVSILLLLSLGYTNCSGNMHAAGILGSKSHSSVSPSLGATPVPTPPNYIAASNTTPITLSGSPYFNAPTVTLTLCTPGTNTCVDVPNVLLDTGSHGLRVFSSLLTAIAPVPVLIAGKQLAECYEYYDGTYGDWGPVKKVDVRIGTETAPSVPVQMIESTFPGIPTSCKGPDTDPSQLGFNGIIGVGVMGADCGPSCVTQTNLNMYYGCTGTSCTGTTVPLASQVTNPISMMPIDNNGLIVKMPDISDSGAMIVTGQLVLGIGTQSNNAANGVTVLPTDQFGYFKTSINGTSYSAQAFDSGTSSNSLSTAAGITSCTTSQLSGFLCPASPQNMSITNLGVSGSPVRPDSIQVANAESLVSSSFVNYKNITDVNTIGVVLWGMPFFYGRSIYIGIEGKTTSVGQGPFWAY